MDQLKIEKSITPRDSASLNKHLAEIGREQLITPEEEVELTARIRKGDLAALNKLVTANLRFVVSVAKQYQRQGLALGDLISEGYLGLIKAAQKFDETRGFKFISYAVWWIRQSILQSIAEHSGMVRLPLNVQGNVSKIKKAFQTVEQRVVRSPSLEEVANELDMPIEKVASTLMQSGKALSIDAPFSDDDENSLVDVLPNNNIPNTDQTLIHESLKMDVERSLTKLTEREAFILIHFFGLKGSAEMTLDEIGEHVGLTRERVRQLKDKTLKKMKKNKLLKSHLG
ncbi:MAG: RNA polymerase sigma factor RpoD/SigA [Tannerella sp.]|jgi:RNA polymerase primary sigma factor|nr:RNA polymerase sigma factor RpoD/SigA [Tannerella sp.]